MSTIIFILCNIEFANIVYSLNFDTNDLQSCHDGTLCQMKTVNKIELNMSDALSIVDSKQKKSLIRLETIFG